MMMMAPIFGSNKDTRTPPPLGQLLKEAIVHLCRTHAASYGSGLVVDGIVCITSPTNPGARENGNVNQEVVIKIHERIGDIGHLLGGKSILDPDVDMKNNNNHNNQLNSPPDDVRTMFGEYQNGDMSDGELPASKRLKEEDSPGSYTEDQAEDLSTGAASSYDIPSPAGSDNSRGNQYLGKCAYLSSPYHLQKKTPLRTERWTPTMPIPTTPECKACGFTFDSFEVLSEHNEAVHSVFTCNSCHKTFTSRSNLERHSRLHTGFKPYVCAICHKAFSRKDHLSNHAAKHAFKCATCSKRFADKKALMHHYTYEHDAPLSHVCDFCNKGFCNQEIYEEHVKTHPQYHAVQRSFQYHHSQHQISSANPQHTCTQCSFSTTDRLSLLKHSIQHTSQRNFACLACGKPFTDALQYDEHLNLHRTGEPLECVLCRQICPSIEILRQHEQVHLMEAESREGDLRPHKCSFCQQGFNTFSELAAHMHELRHHPQQQMQQQRQQQQATDLSISTPQPESDVTQENSQDYDGEQMEEQQDEKSEKNEESMDQLVDEEKDEKQNEETEEKTETSKVNDDDLGSDIEVVEPVAPEDDIPSSPPSRDEASEREAAIKSEPLRSLLASSKLNSTTERARKRKAPSPEKFVPPPPPYIEPSLGGFYRPAAEPYELTPQDLSMKGLLGAGITSGSPVGGHMTAALAARAAAAFAEGHLRAAHERYRMDLERLERERMERDRYEKLQRDRDSQRTPQSTTSKSNIDIPPGPQTCSVCNTTYNSFHEMETHCFVEHNRSPCMFCSKTFAQKANRDRHVCLHTGDKPYACPDCDEKFSRGDKLKLHRVRAHNLQTTPITGRSNKESSNNNNNSAGWSSPSTNHSDDGWIASYKKDSDIVHAGGEWVTETENGHVDS